MNTNKKNDNNEQKKQITFKPIDLLTAEQIKEKLYNYEQVDRYDIENLFPGTRIQYFEIMENNKFRFKPGGIITINGYPNYLVLTNGRKSWSVQLVNHIIFKEQSVDLIVKKYIDIINQKNQEIDHLISLIKTQKRKLREYEKIKKIKE